MARNSYPRQMRRLLAITPPLETPLLEKRVERLLRCEGANHLMLLVRSPLSDTARWLTTGRRIRELCSLYTTPIIIGRRTDIAVALQADGVHLRSRGITVAQARALLPRHSIIGASVHNEDEISQRQDATYLTLSPFAHSPQKGTPLGKETFHRLAKMASPPVYALGGITHTNAAQALAAGAHGLAFIRSAFPSAGPPSVEQIGICLEASLDSESS